ncbi:unnamed protein product [Lactuca saligna]|uniref:Uncharacterized protein n=1 Tax=Lactuca saligna TaxID=75948 RepID=A0AA36A5I8_LACSI|nr:unnamed protein product [Lactuca saligna]
MIPKTDLDSGLLPLGTDLEVIQVARYVPNHKEINLCIEHGKTRVVPYFKSPLKVRIEEVHGDHSPEMDRLIERVIPLGGGVRFEDKQGKRVINTGDDHQPKGDVDPVDDYEVMRDVDAEYGGPKNLHDVEFFEDEYSESKESVSEGAWSEDSRSKESHNAAAPSPISYTHKFRTASDMNPTSMKSTPTAELRPPTASSGIAGSNLESAALASDGSALNDDGLHHTVSDLLQWSGTKLLKSL